MSHVEAESLSIDYSESGEEPVVLDGRIDPESYELLDSILAQQLDAALYILLDLANVVYVSSDGLRTLVKKWKEAKQRGGELVIVDPHKRVREVLDLSGFLKLMTVFGSQEQAIAHIHALLGYADDDQSAVE